jgi:hypothetical protein
VWSAKKLVGPIDRKNDRPEPVLMQPEGSGFQKKCPAQLRKIFKKSSGHELRFSKIIRLRSGVFWKIPARSMGGVCINPPMGLIRIMLFRA